MAHRDSLDPRRRAQSLWRSGVELIVGNLYQEAASLLREAVLLDPHLAAAHNDLGVLMESLGNPHEALHCYHAALVADPRHREAQRNLVTLALQLDLKRALRHRTGLSYQPAA